MSGQNGIRIETERLIVRSARADDAEALSALWDAVGEVKPWNTRTPQEMRAQIRAADPEAGFREIERQGLLTNRIAQQRDSPRQRVVGGKRVLDVVQRT